MEGAAKGAERKSKAYTIDSTEPVHSKALDIA